MATVTKRGRPKKGEGKRRVGFANEFGRRVCDDEKLFYGLFSSPAYIYNVFDAPRGTIGFFVIISRTLQSPRADQPRRFRGRVLASLLPKFL